MAHYRRHATHAGLSKSEARRLNYEALYASSSRTGSYRDSRGYKILQEAAYAAQRSSPFTHREEEA